jgi:hypothetical protein
MSSGSATRGLLARDVRAWLALAWIAVAAVMVAVKAASVVLDEAVHLFTKDVASLADLNWYAGAISNAGGILWFVGATACGLAWFVAARGALGSPLLHLSLFLVIVGADDVFLLHEGLYSKAVEEELPFTIYAVALVAFAVLHRRFLADRGVLVLAPLALVFFAASAFMDRTYDEKQTIEDGTKLLGIATLVVLALRLALESLAPARLDEAREPT